MNFKLVSEFQPQGDQIKAIEQLAQNFNNGIKEQVLLGATATGKTFTICNIIQKINRPTLVLAHNKTLAGQLYTEIKQFFPNNHVEYFISYYDYYQPEAYVPSSDTYIEKDAQVNDEIDQMRHAATSALMEYEDTIIVASISCIYGLGDPETYRKSMLRLSVGQSYKRKQILHRLVELLYERNEIDFARGTFRLRGDVLEIILASERKEGIRIEFFDEEIERIRKFDTLTGVVTEDLDTVIITPAKHFLTDKDKLKIALERIRYELLDRIEQFKAEEKLLEAQRIRERTNYDLEMLEQVGYCSGVENYSRHLALRGAGETPATLMDFFGDDFLLVIDESHVTVPQIRGMYNGDRSRKQSLVDYGFRLPSALDNRPLTFAEFFKKSDKIVYVSATPGVYELSKNIPVVEQIIRPTGLLDPIIEVRPTEGQIDDLYSEIVKRVALKERVLVTTLTIRMSEDLTAYLAHLGVKVAYLHSEIKSLERTDILRDLRLGRYDVLVGINLLREGLDLPEVSLVAILDADKQGFLRSERSLIQTIGRAARNSNGRVIMYASSVSPSMDVAIEETNRRRTIQEAHNEKYGIVPTTIQKEVFESLSIKRAVENKGKKLDDKEYFKQIESLEKDMLLAAKKLDFEAAAAIRDLILDMKAERSRKR